MNGQARGMEVFCFRPLGEQHLGGWKAGMGVSNKYPWTQVLWQTGS